MFKKLQKRARRLGANLIAQTDGTYALLFFDGDTLLVGEYADIDEVETFIKKVEDKINA